MSASLTHLRHYAVCLCLGMLGNGCSLLTGSPTGSSTPTHRLLSEAKEFRASMEAPGAPRELNKTLLSTHVVGPGDVLLVQQAELDAAIRLPPDQPVQPDGTIDLGKYGRPVVAGKTVPVIEAELQKLVSSQTKETVTVTVRIINRQSRVYYVLGEVNAPGAFPIIGRETVLDAIVTAGGLTRRASEPKIILSRPTLPDGCRVVLPVCYPQIVQLGDTSTNYQVMPGDRIYVPSLTTLEGMFPCFQPRNDCGTCSKLQVPCLGGENRPCTATTDVAPSDK